MESLKKREGDLLPTLKTVFFEGLKNKYERKTIKDVLLSYKGGSWGNEYFAGGINAKVLRSPDIRFGFIDFENAEERYFTKKEFDNFSLKNNDILVIKSNGSLDLVGKSQIYKENKAFRNVIASNFLMVLSPDQEIVYPEYLDLFLKSPESLVWRFDTQKTTTGLRNLNSSAFLSIDIPVPDTIQEQIELYNSFLLYLKGEIIDSEIVIRKFYSLSKIKETISTELTHQLSLVKKLRQQLLQDAVQGKLIEQNPKDEPASELLKKIKAENEQLIKEKKLKKGKELPAIKKEEIPFEIPEGWVWCRLGEICEGSFYGPRFSSSSYIQNGIPTIRTTDMTDDGRIELNETPTVMISDEKKVELYKIKDGDLLLTRSGSIGIMAIFRGDYLAIASAYLIRFRFLTDISPEFIFYLLKSPYWQGLLGLNSTATAQVNINATNILKLPIPLPPLPEQHRIVQKLDQLMQTCNELEGSIKQSASQNEKLLQQVLREALEPGEEGVIV